MDPMGIQKLVPVTLGPPHLLGIQTCHYPPSDDFRHDILRMTWVGELCPCGQLRWQHPRPFQLGRLKDENDENGLSLRLGFAYELYN